MSLVSLPSSCIHHYVIIDCRKLKHEVGVAYDGIILIPHFVKNGQLVQKLKADTHNILTA